MELANYKIYIAIGITILLLALLVIFMVIPTIQAVYSLAGQVKAEKIELATFEAKEKNIKILKEKQVEVDEKLKVVESALISPDNSLALILSLEKMASQNKVEQNISILNVPDEKRERTKDKKGEYSLDNIPYIPVSVRTGGTFNNILTYLLAIEQMGTYTDTTVITIAASSGSTNIPTTTDEGEEEQTDDLSATMEMRAFTIE